MHCPHGHRRLFLRRPDGDVLHGSCQQRLCVCKTVPTFYDPELLFTALQVQHRGTVKSASEDESVRHFLGSVPWLPPRLCFRRRTDDRAFGDGMGAALWNGGVRGVRCVLETETCTIAFTKKCGDPSHESPHFLIAYPYKCRCA